MSVNFCVILKKSLFCDILVYQKSKRKIPTYSIRDTLMLTPYPMILSKYIESGYLMPYVLKESNPVSGIKRLFSATGT